MENIIEMNYSYGYVKGTTSEKIRSVFERLMESVSAPNGIEIDNLYYASNFADTIGEAIPSPILTGLVNRGMLYCDGKVNNKNVYAITTEIYNYYKNTYKPGFEKNEERLNKIADRFLAVRKEN